MITLYSTHGCSRCEAVKNVLQSKGIEFRVQMIENLPDEVADSVMDKASEAGAAYYPIIERDDGTIVTDLKEL